jgi:TetR/AcrR family transcriptional repressor of nem operon
MKFVPRSESTRQFIIERTANVFNKKGYAGTSMSDLTDVTGLTKGSIYGNFENKDAVALAVFDYTVTRLQRAIAEKVNKETSNKNKLLAYARAYDSAEKTFLHEGGCPLLNTGAEADDTHEPLRKRVAQYFTSWKKDIMSIISNGIAAKEFRVNTNAEKTALAMMALIEGGILIARVTKNSASLDNVLESVKGLVAEISTGSK